MVCFSILSQHWIWMTEEHYQNTKLSHSLENIQTLCLWNPLYLYHHWPNLLNISNIYVTEEKFLICGRLWRIPTSTIIKFLGWIKYTNPFPGWMKTALASQLNIKIMSVFRCMVLKCWKFRISSSILFVKFEFLTVLLLRIHVFWDVMPCELINSYQFFEGTLVTFTSQHGITSKKAWIFNSWFICAVQ